MIPIRRSALPAFALALLGVAIAVYMVWVHYQETALICGVGNCEKVQTSEYATMFGVPIAWFGLAMYVTLVALLVVRETRLELADVASVGVFGLTFAGTLYCAYLTYLEIWVIEAICQWCVTFAIVTVASFILATIHLTRVFLSTSAD